MQLLQLLIGGVAQGCIYGLIALGFVLIYKATETVSFAQGDLMMVGAFGGLLTMTLLGFPFWVSVLAAVIGMGLFGVLLERMVIRPILGQPAFSIVMLTIGVGYVLRGVITMIPNIGTDTHSLAVPYAGEVLSMGGLAQYRLFVVLFAAGLLFVVSEAFGDGKKPGAIDLATKSIVKRLHSAPPAANSNPGHYETAVAQSDAGESESATMSGHSCAASGSRSRTCASLASLRPASAIRVPAGACSARYRAVSSPTKPVAP